ncbi:MAG: hypothetical protein K8F91_25935 [Candidatus Obscuribacterales bacterium]|nr:hypothetical protein [Candidatus Obscuribacterales bacterium]
MPGKYYLCAIKNQKYSVHAIASIIAIALDSWLRLDVARKPAFRAGLSGSYPHARAPVVIFQGFSVSEQAERDFFEKLEAHQYYREPEDKAIMPAGNVCPQTQN